ncbi:MAG: glycogen synthase [Candidatus Eiseniibacteriota bacterium]
MNPLRIAYVTSEVAPFAKTGGLGDVSAALPAALLRAGHDVRVFTPLYSVIDLEAFELNPVEGLQDLVLKTAERVIPYSVYQTVPIESGVRVYFVHCPMLYDRESIYTSDPDEPLRFILLQRATLEASQRLGWGPHIFHCHDWQTSLIPLYLKTVYAWDQLFRSSRSVLTIHNLGYQGVFAASHVEDAGLSPAAKHLDAADLRAGRVGFLKTGIRWADLITTVSPTYAEEIRTPEFGVGLDALLRERADSMMGILNGVDTAVWNPRTDPFLPYRYSAKSVWRKERNKAALLQEVGLPYRKDVPVIGMITRLTFQKGLDLLPGSLPAVIEAGDLRLVALGSGEEKHERFFAGLQERFPGKVHFRRGFDAELAHRIEAGSDMFLMPSLYEPCGLNQMYSRIYGTVPIVRRTGGLADTVDLWDPDTREGSGVVFDHPTAEGVRWALQTALALHADPETWKVLRRNTMDCDFSWDHQVLQYEEGYARVTAAEGAGVGG